MHGITITQEITYTICATPGCDKVFMVPLKQYGLRNHCDECAGRDSDMVAMAETKREASE